MKESVFDKQNLKEKEDELKLLNDILKKEEIAKQREKKDFIKHRANQKNFREYLARQIKEKQQIEVLEKEEKLSFLKQILNRDASEQKEEKAKIQKHKKM